MDDVDVVELISQYKSKLSGLVEIVDGKPVFRNGSGEVMEELRLDVVRFIAGGSLGNALNWIHHFNSAVERLREALGVKGVVLPKELKSFIRDPWRHLSKKLYQATLDLARGMMEVSEYYYKARSALTTSLMTNMRSLYQYWVFTSLLAEYGYRGGVMVYPEHGYLHIERSGRQRAGSIPANAIIRLPGAREASFYAEAPRPIGWGDSRGLERAWSLYTSLRPDFIVYSGRVPDMVEYRGGKMGIRRPNVIIECKELPDWYTRTRYLKGPMNKAFTAEEWYSRWFEGLKEGLATILGERIQESRRPVEGVRVREYRLILLYKEAYKPDTLILVSRSKLPDDIRVELEEEDVRVIDGVEMGEEGLVRELADVVEGYFGHVKDRPLDEVEYRLWLRGLHVERGKLEEVLAEIALEMIDEIQEKLVDGRA